MMPVRALISMPQPSQWGTPSRQHHTKAFFRTDSGNSIRLIPRRLLTSPAPVEDRELGDELSPALALRSPANRRGTRTCVFANRENVGRVDHPEHHAQARPKVERRL